MNTWAESKQQIGQFTGSTGANILSQAELSSGYQAWARKVHKSYNSMPFSAQRWSSLKRLVFILLHTSKLIEVPRLLFTMPISNEQPAYKSGISHFCVSCV